MPKHRETVRLAECANIRMEEFFLLKLIRSFIDAHYWIIPALGGLHSSLPSPELWVTQKGTRDTGGRARALLALWALSAIVVLRVTGTSSSRAQLRGGMGVPPYSATKHPLVSCRLTIF